MLPQMIARPAQAAKPRARARELLGYLGLEERVEHRPAELSGGEQQRVAIARAVANAPRILLADEPTGNLDPRTAERVFAALTALVRASGLAALVATHNMELAARMDRRVTLRDGKLVEIGRACRSLQSPSWIPPPPGRQGRTVRGAEDRLLVDAGAARSTCIVRASTHVVELQAAWADRGAHEHGEARSLIATTTAHRNLP